MAKEASFLFSPQQVREQIAGDGGGFRKERFASGVME